MVNKKIEFLTSVVTLQNTRITSHKRILSGTRAGRYEWEKQKVEDGMQSVSEEKYRPKGGEKTLGCKRGEV